MAKNKSRSKSTAASKSLKEELRVSRGKAPSMVDAAAAIRAKGWPCGAAGNLSLMAYRTDKGPRLAVLAVLAQEDGGEQEVLVADITPQEFDQMAMQFTVWMVRMNESAGGKET